jgi:hypothetical protein
VPDTTYRSCFAYRLPKKLTRTLPPGLHTMIGAAGRATTATDRRVTASGSLATSEQLARRVGEREAVVGSTPCIARVIACLVDGGTRRCKSATRDGQKRLLPALRGSALIRLLSFATPS